MQKHICVWILVLMLLVLCGCESTGSPATTVAPIVGNTTLTSTSNQMPPATTAVKNPSTSIEPTVASPTTVPTTAEKGPETVLQDGVELLYSTERVWEGFAGNGFYYRDEETKLYGVLSADGHHDTGPIYYNVKTNGDYFQVTKKQPSSPENIDDINSTGLIDETGKVLIPTEYAIIEPCENNRFFRVIKATEVTESKEEALLYMYTGFFSIAPSDEDTLYKGVWYFFDTQAGKVIDGIALTNKKTAGVKGNMMFYYDDAGNAIKASVDGKKIPEDVQILENGSYYFYEGTAVYDVFGNKVFNFDPEKYIYWENGYYIAQSYKDGSYSCVVLDEDGKEVSAVFESASVHVFAKDLILCDAAVCDFAGNKLVEGEFDTIIKTGDFWEISNYETKQFYLLNEELDVVFGGSDRDKFELYGGCLTRENGDKTLIYSFKQKAFVYEGDVLDHGFIRVNKGEEQHELINTYTDETIISGPSCAYVIHRGTNSVTYIYARYSDYTYTKNYIYTIQ